MKERTTLDNRISAVREIETTLKDNIELIQLGEEEGDDGIVREAEAGLEKLRVSAEKKQLESLLSGEADGNDAFLNVNAGAGGTEAQDWGEMLLRMYMRWAERRGYKVSLLERSDGEEAGIKSATIRISGDQVYGWLKTETGVHRLVRISFRSRRKAPHKLCLRVGLAGSGRQHRDRSSG